MNIRLSEDVNSFTRLTITCSICLYRFSDDEADDEKIERT